MNLRPKDPNNVSPARLRVGVGLFLLFWIPVWLLIPSINKLFGITSDSGKTIVTAAVLTTQTICGLLGFLIAGQQVKVIFKETPRRQLPKKVFHTLF